MQYHAMDQPAEAEDQQMPLLPCCLAVLLVVVLLSIHWPTVRELLLGLAVSDTARQAVFVIDRPLLRARKGSGRVADASRRATSCRGGRVSEVERRHAPAGSTRTVCSCAV